MKELLLHSLVVSPVVRWIASPSRRWSRKTGIRLAALGLLVIAMLQLRRMDPNCHELIGVDRFASPAEISRAFRKQTIEFHPDRPRTGPLPFGFETANEVFIQLQKCHETVTNSDKFKSYNRHGKLDYAFKNEATVLPVMAVFSFISYIVSFIVSTIFTAAPEAQASRRWIYSFLAFAFSCEMLIKYLRQDDLFAFIPYFNKWMIFEQVDALKALIPSALSSGLLLSQLTHVDGSDVTNEILQCLSESNREIAAHIVSKRNGASLPLTPAVIKLMQPAAMRQPPVPAPTGGVGQTTPAADPQAAEAARAAPQFWSMQRVFNWLFYAYVIKLVVGALRSSFGI